LEELYLNGWIGYGLVSGVGMLVLVCTLVMVLALVLSAADLQVRGAQAAVVFALAAASSAIPLAALQWLIVRRNAVQLGWWLLASAAGAAAGSALVFGVWGVTAALRPRPDPYFDRYLALSAAVVTPVLGTGQWLVLRRRVSEAGWWLLASTLGGIVGVAVEPTAFVLFSVFLGMGG
jgi:hypothetical protein